MEYINSKRTLAQIQQAWKLQMYNNGKWYAPGHETVYNKLCELKRYSKSKIDAIIGNETWTSEWCSECRKYKVDLIQFGPEDEHIRLCKECVAEAYLNLILRY